MKSADYTSDEKIVHTLYHATMLPVALYQQEQCLLAYPEDQPSLTRLRDGEETLSTLHVSQGQFHMPQHVASRYGESFLYFELGGGRALLFGAFLSLPMDGGDVYRLIRSLGLPISAYQQLLSYFSTLPVVDESRHFFIGQLLQLLFRVRRLGGVERLPVQNDQIDSALFQRRYENRIESFNHPPFFLEQILAQAIQIGDRRKALRTLSEINALSRATLARDPLRSLKNSLIGSCVLYARAAIAGGASSRQAFTLSDAYIQAMEQVHDMRRLEHMEEQMLLSFIGLVEERQRQQHSPVTRAAIRYIEGHLTEKITLAMIAEAVFVHPSYLSQRFRKDTEMTLGFFIQQRRIEEAQHFMRHTNSPISEIASFYQFCSQSHFIQVFKKHTGKTPEAFRKEFVD